ncbi:IS5 family transposase [Streptomyces caelestis]|uniref:IS5 family transposase n=1 Tax=Streptomyces caelestis TaxID=36816 RepID=UPI00364BD7D2
MSDDLVPDDLWDRVAPLLPPRPPRRRRYPGRLPADDRAALRGIVYVLRTGMIWADVPTETIGCSGVIWADVPTETIGCSGVTCRRRLRDWTEAGVWPRLHEVLLSELRRAGLLDMDDAAIDGSHVRALKRGAHPGPSPVDRARPGSKHHLITDRHGTPLAVSLTSGNRHDVTQLMPLLDAIPRIRGLVGRPRHRPRRLFADRGYDYDKCRRLLQVRGITPKIARKGTAHGSGLGKTRWVVERTFAWLHQFKRLRIRYEIRAELHLGLLQLAYSIICLRRLRTSF